MIMVLKSEPFKKPKNIEFRVFGTGLGLNCDDTIINFIII